MGTAKRGGGLLSLLVPDWAVASDSVRGLEEVCASVDRVAAVWREQPWTGLQQAWIPADRTPWSAQVAAPRQAVIAHAEVSSPLRGRSYIEVLVDERTPPQRCEHYAAEFAKRWSTDGGQTVARCTRKDLKARVRRFATLRKKALTPGPVWLGGRRRQDVARPADLPADDLKQWWIHEYQAHHHRRSTSASTVPSVAAPAVQHQKRTLKPRVRGRRMKKRRQTASPRRR
jgi:hypothetical protein